MPIQGSEPAGLGESAKQIAEHASALARLELRLAVLELSRKGKVFAVGIALALAALLLLLAAIAAAIPLDTWASLLIVTFGLLVVIAILGFLAVSSFKKATPPVPKQAIEEAKLTTEAIKAGHG